MELKIPHLHKAQFRYGNVVYDHIYLQASDLLTEPKTQTAIKN